MQTLGMSDKAIARRRHVFEATFYASEVGHAALFELAKMWHFFDPDCKTEQARIRRQCLIEIMQWAGAWPQGDVVTNEAAVYDAFTAMVTRLHAPQTEGPPK